MKRVIVPTITFLLLVITFCSLLQLQNARFLEVSSPDVSSLVRYQEPIPEPAIRAYETNMEITFPTMNLTDVEARAASLGYRVMHRDYVHEWTPGKGTIHTTASVQLNEHGTGINLEYDKYAGITHVHLGTGTPGERFDPLWDRLSEYMHTSVSALESSLVVEHLGEGTGYTDFIVPGEPDWDAVRSDMGMLTERHSRWLGRDFELYDGGSFLNMTGYTIVEAESEVAVLSGTVKVYLRASLDGFGHCKFEVFESRKVWLDDIHGLYEPVLGSLGLSTSMLDTVSFDGPLWLM